MFPTTLVIDSNRDGRLCQETSWIESKGCYVASLSPGQHMITATATDAFGATGKDTAVVTVNNEAPLAKITYPADGTSYYLGQALNLRGYGFDPDEANLTLSWQSSISGHLGNGKDIWVNLSIGSHVITLTARDSIGAEGTYAITVIVHQGTGHPTAKITQPQSGTIYTPGTPILLQGEGSDPEDGSLSGMSLRWRSNYDGDLGTGAALKTTLSGPNCGMKVHQVTLEAIDAAGNKDTHTIQISVGRIC